MSTETITPIQALKYEVAASWWVPYISIEWIQNLAAKYYARKVNRKITRIMRRDKILRGLRS